MSVQQQMLCNTRKKDRKKRSLFYIIKYFQSVDRHYKRYKCKKKSKLRGEMLWRILKDSATSILKHLTHAHTYTHQQCGFFQFKLMDARAARLPPLTCAMIWKSIHVVKRRQTMPGGLSCIAAAVKNDNEDKCFPFESWFFFFSSCLASEKMDGG